MYLCISNSFYLNLIAVSANPLNFLNCINTNTNDQNMGALWW